MSHARRQKRKSALNPHFVPQKTALAVAIGLALSGQIQPVAAEIYTVDKLDASGGIPGSLANALAIANETSEADEIVFQDGLTGTINASAGLTISNPLTITGPGRDVITINTACETTCIDMFTITSSGAVTISGLTLDSNDIGFTQSLILHNGSGTLTIDDCDLLNTGGHISGSDGGAISNVAGDLTIQNSTISGHNSVGEGGAISVGNPGIFTLESSTISGNTSDGDGGGISLDAVMDVSISDSTISGNTATNGDGGGIYYNPVATGALPFVLQDSTLSGNNADSGGGLYMALDAGDSTDLTITNSVFSGNTTNGDIGGGLAVVSVFGASTTFSAVINDSVFDDNTGQARGGGIGILGDKETTVQINNTTISNNDTVNESGAGSGGGGLYLRGVITDLEVINTTISGNINAGDATDGGGGVYIDGTSEAPPLDADFLHVTVTDNASPNGRGGGISAPFSINNGILTIVNSIVAGNSAPTGPDMYAQDELTSVINIDYSLIGDGTDSDLTEITMSNIIGTTAASADPMLDDLADNGGTQAGVDADVPLLTHAILEGSSVISAADQSVTGSSLTLPATDQRGSGFDRIRDGGLDMGAVEYIDASSSSSSSSSSGGSSSGGGGGSSGGAGGPVLLLSLLTLLGLHRRKG